jgi:hypothetical protein
MSLQRRGDDEAVHASVSPPRTKRGQQADSQPFSPDEMLSKSLLTSTARSAKSAPMGARFASHLPIPPKVATPKSVQGPGGDSSRMDSVVAFYKSLPKGAAPSKSGGGIKAR